jgi:hypothetical protein
MVSLESASTTRTESRTKTKTIDLGNTRIKIPENAKRSARFHYSGAQFLWVRHGLSSFSMRQDSGTSCIVNNLSWKPASWDVGSRKKSTACALRKFIPLLALFGKLIRLSPILAAGHVLASSPFLALVSPFSANGRKFLEWFSV